MGEIKCYQIVKCQVQNATYMGINDILGKIVDLLLLMDLFYFKKIKIQNLKVQVRKGLF